MYQKAKLLLTLAIALIFGTPAAFAGAWTQPDSAMYLKLGVSSISAERYIDAQGNTVDIPTKSLFTLSFYGEYGLSDKLTVFAYIPFLTTVTVEEGRDENGVLISEAGRNTTLGDFEAGLRYGLLQSGPLVVSAALTLGLPLGDFEQNDVLSTGDGEANQIISLLAGYSLYPLYASAEIGFNQRSNSYSDELRYGLEIGAAFPAGFMVIARSRGIQSLKNGGSATTQAGVSQANDQQYLNYGLALLWNFNRNIGIELGYEGATNARNVLSAPNYLAGVFVKLP